MQRRIKKGGMGRRLWRAGLALCLGLPLIGWVFLINPRLAPLVAAAALLPALILPRPRGLPALLNLAAGAGLLLIGLGFHLTIWRMALGIAPGTVKALTVLAALHWLLLRRPLLGRMFSAGYVALALLPALFLGHLPWLLWLLIVGAWIAGTLLALGAAWRPGRPLAWALGWLLIGQSALVGAFYVVSGGPFLDTPPGLRQILNCQERELPGQLRFAAPTCDGSTLLVGAKSDVGRSGLLALDLTGSRGWREIALAGSISDNLLAICDPPPGEQPRLLISDQRRGLLLDLDPLSGELCRETPIGGVRPGQLARGTDGLLFVAQDLSSAVQARNTDGAAAGTIELGQQTLDIAVDSGRGLVWQAGEAGKLIAFRSVPPFEIVGCWDLEQLTRPGFRGAAPACGPDSRLRRSDRYQLVVAGDALLVARMFSGTLSAIDISGETLATVNQIELGRGLRNLAWTPLPQQRIVVANFLTGEISVLDGSLKLLASYAIGPRARWITLDRSGTRAFATSSSGVFEIDLN